MKSFDEDSCDEPVVNVVDAVNSVTSSLNVKSDDVVGPDSCSVSVTPLRPDADKHNDAEDKTNKSEPTDPSIQIKDSFLLSPRRGSGDRRASLGSIGGNGMKQRTGALLPSLPNKVLEGVRDSERTVVRTGSLSEQEFIEQLKASQLLSREHESPQRKPPPIIAESTNFEIDEEYERQGEYPEDDDELDEDDPQAMIEDVIPGDVYTIPEESEEDLTSPRSTDPVVQTSVQQQTQAVQSQPIQQKAQQQQTQSVQQKEVSRGQSNHPFSTSSSSVLIFFELSMTAS